MKTYKFNDDVCRRIVQVFQQAVLFNQDGGDLLRSIEVVVDEDNQDQLRLDGDYMTRVQKQYEDLVEAAGNLPDCELALSEINFVKLLEHDMLPNVSAMFDQLYNTQIKVNPFCQFVITHNSEKETTGTFSLAGYDKNDVELSVSIDEYRILLQVCNKSMGSILGQYFSHDIDADTVKASMKNGLLEISWKKRNKQEDVRFVTIN